MLGMSDGEIAVEVVGLLEWAGWVEIGMGMVAGRQVIVEVVAAAENLDD